MKPAAATKLKHVLYAVGAFIAALVAAGVVPEQYVAILSGVAGLLTGTALPAPGSLQKEPSE